MESRGLYSLVDWNMTMIWWIGLKISRGLYSLVDWNNLSTGGEAPGEVEAYTASWIEM